MRTFTITDFALLSAYQKQALFLHNQLVLTQGPGAVSRAAWLSPLAAFTGSFTYVSSANGSRGALIGQAKHGMGSAVAHCTLLAPGDLLDSHTLPELIDRLLARVGERGAQSLLAEVDESEAAYGALRQAGFSGYARQRVWKITKPPRAKANSFWSPLLGSDEFAVQILRNSLLPGQVQQIETDDAQRDGYVHYRDGELQAYMEVSRGPHGIWLQPFVHLDAEPIDEMLADLMAKLRPRPSRPVYVSLRSYQDWLEGALQDLGAQPGPRQAAMARRTTVSLKVEEARRAPVAKRSTEPSAPIHALAPAQRHEPEWIVYDQTPNYR